MKLLVTGVAGFIGSNFVYYWRSHHSHDEIIGLDKLTYAGNLHNLEALSREQKGRFRFIRGDIGDIGLVHEILEKNAVDKIVNFAAESHVDRSIRDPQVFLRSNILGTACLLDAARDFWKYEDGWLPEKRFLQVSTDEGVRIPWPDRILYRKDPARSPQPVLGEQGIRRPSGKGLP